MCIVTTTTSYWLAHPRTISSAQSTTTGPLKIKTPKKFSRLIFQKLQIMLSSKTSRKRYNRQWCSTNRAAKDIPLAYIMIRQGRRRYLSPHQMQWPSLSSHPLLPLREQLLRCLTVAWARSPHRYPSLTSCIPARLISIVRSILSLRPICSLFRRKSFRQLRSKTWYRKRRGPNSSMTTLTSRRPSSSSRGQCTPLRHSTPRARVIKRI